MRSSLAAIGCLMLTLVLRGQVTFVLEQIPANTPPADTIFLAGPFNEWAAAHPGYRFHRTPAGQYLFTLPAGIAPPFEFKLTRGSWERVETNSLGQFLDNRRYEGAGRGDTVRLTVLNWEDLPVDARYGWLDIRVESLPKNTPPDASLYAVGSFNGWYPGDPHYRLIRGDDGAFRGRIPLMDDTTYYKFTRGGWETIEGRHNGRARPNRQFVRGDDNPPGEVTVRIESWEDLAGNPINLYTFILLLAAIQGLLLILAVNTLQNNNRAANRVLSVLLLMLSLALAGRVSTYDREIFQWMPRLLLLPDFIYFLYAPVFLLYIYRLLRLPGGERLGIGWWHFLPFLAQAAFYTPLILMPKEAFITEVVNQDLKPFFAWSGGLALIVNAGYWAACRRAIRQYERESDDEHAFEPNLRFLRVVMWLKLACLIIWSATYAIGGAGLLLGKDLSFLTDASTDALWAVFSFTTFFLGYYTMRQPEIFKLPAPDAPVSEQAQEEQEKAASLSDADMIAIKTRLEQAMDALQPYRNPGLSLTGLAEAAGATPHALSRVINEGYGMNFNDFVNSYRVAAFKHLVQQEEYRHHTLLAIAFEVGFNSKSAFNRSFKKLENRTPREYLQHLEGNGNELALDRRE